MSKQQNFIHRLAKNFHSQGKIIGCGSLIYRDPSPSVGQIYCTTDTKQTFICEIDGIWEEWDDNNIVFDEVTNCFSFYVGIAPHRVEIMRICPNGVGIGVGTDRYILPVVDGTVGQILVTDGNGNVSWQDNTGGEMLPTQTITIQGSVSTVPDNALTTIVSYTNTSGGDLWLNMVTGTGNLDALYTLFINTNEIDNLNSAEQDRNVKFAFVKAIKVANGDIIDVKVKHFYNGKSGDFKSTIYLHKYA